MKRLKGSPRRGTAERQNLHFKVQQIPSQQALDEFIDLHPRAIRGELREQLAPHTRFNARAER